MTNRGQLYAFFAGAETFHALVHAYLSVTGADIEHPAERFGIEVTPKFHAIAAAVNAAIALGLAVCAVRSARRLRARRVTPADVPSQEQAPSSIGRRLTTPAM